MIPFTLNKDISFELPQDYGELTLKQFLALKNTPNGDIADMLSILSGLSRETWEQCRDFNIDVKIAPYLDWIKEQFNPANYTLSDKITISGKEVLIPQNIKSEHFGQKLALEKRHYKNLEAGGNEYDLIPFAIANYLQPHYFNNDKYDSSQVEELLPLIMNCKVEEALPIGSFFLNSYAKLLVSKETSFLMFLHRKKAELELIDLKSLKSSGQSTLFQRVSIRVMKMFSKWIIILYSLRYGMKRNRLATKGN